jgi:hypothetical protein
MDIRPPGNRRTVADYDWSYETSINGAADLTAEQWLRAIWEDGPRPLPHVLPVAWRLGLGLRLGPSSDAARVLGWRITRSEPEAVTVVAESRIMSAENTVSRDGGRLEWRTLVTYEHLISRVLWMPARLVHQWLVRLTMRRAVRMRRDR